LILLGKQAIDDDSNQTGQLLAGILNWSNLILLGKQAIDDDSNQTGQLLAGILNWSQVSEAR
jgi:electron transfer flavoprotein alpha/beta subunit